MSVFGYDDPRRNYGAVTQYTSGTILDTDGTIVMRHGDVSTVLHPNTFKPWTLIVNGVRIPVLDPRVQYLRSETRFMSGMKEKDKDKLALMDQELGKVFGADWRNAPVCRPLVEFHGKMLHGSTTKAMQEALSAPAPLVERSAHGARVAGRITLRRLGIIANRSRIISRFVQSSNDLFDRSIGAAK